MTDEDFTNDPDYNLFNLHFHLWNEHWNELGFKYDMWSQDKEDPICNGPAIEDGMPVICKTAACALGWQTTLVPDLKLNEIGNPIYRPKGSGGFFTASDAGAAVNGISWEEARDIFVYANLPFSRYKKKVKSVKVSQRRVADRIEHVLTGKVSRI